uniref:protein-tyrosine-phosphatase n=1 Tax=Timspurckia oligopyrenoides TaxID=708627 RepID=A0A7S1EUR5_9RHOD|mmetsp:Transcript_9066/g.16323  ORF Transcript_9066/g.16323 Transcript_9066/m.16323 type:complete len:329 (+) Transcript_9066:493-1479(+)
MMPFGERKFPTSRTRSEENMKSSTTMEIYQEEEEIHALDDSKSQSVLSFQAVCSDVTQSDLGDSLDFSDCRDPLQSQSVRHGASSAGCGTHWQVSGDTVSSWLSSASEGCENGVLKSQVIVIDCRFPFEFDGGHVKNAHNICSAEEAISFLFSNPDYLHAASERRLRVVLHCEFSSHRAPYIFKAIRSHDRQENIDSYPDLSFPMMYVMTGGFKDFYQTHSLHCTPEGAYVPMRIETHRQQMQVYMKKFTNQRRKPRELSRSKSLGCSLPSEGLDWLGGFALSCSTFSSKTVPSGTSDMDSQLPRGPKADSSPKRRRLVFKSSSPDFQ